LAFYFMLPKPERTKASTAVPIVLSLSQPSTPSRTNGQLVERLQNLPPANPSATGSPLTQTHVADLDRDPAAISAKDAQQQDVLHGMNSRATNHDKPKGARFEKKK